jgi:hypothetical protein
MAIHPIMIQPPHTSSEVRQSANVAAWTEQATEALRSVDLSAEAAQNLPRATSITLTVPLDDRHASGSHLGTGAKANRNRGSRQVHTTYRRSEPISRDSLNRREALLKGKEADGRMVRCYKDE